MRIEDVKVGMKVVPHSKSTRGDLWDSHVWKSAQAIGQKFLYVDATYPMAVRLCLSMDDKPPYAFFKYKDFEPYVEPNTGEDHAQPQAPQVQKFSTDVEYPIGTIVELEDGSQAEVMECSNGCPECIFLHHNCASIICSDIARGDNMPITFKPIDTKTELPSDWTKGIVNADPKPEPSMPKPSPMTAEPPKAPKSLTEKINTFLEDLQEAKVQAGGVFTRRDEFMSMALDEILRSLMPNNVEFTAKYVRPKK